MLPEVIVLAMTDSVLRLLVLNLKTNQTKEMLESDTFLVLSLHSLQETYKCKNLYNWGNSVFGFNNSGEKYL